MWSHQAGKIILGAWFVMKPLKLYHVVDGVTINDINTYLISFATTENQDDQSTEAQHGELEEIHCASSLGGKSSSCATCQYINSPNQVLYMICTIRWENLTFCETCLPQLSFRTCLCLGFQCNKSSIWVWNFMGYQQIIFDTTLSFWTLALRLVPMLIKNTRLDFITAIYVTLSS